MPNDDLTEVKISLGRIEGMLGVKHIEYDRRLADLEQRSTGALGKTAAIVSPLIAGVAIVVSLASKVAWQ